LEISSARKQVRLTHLSVLIYGQRKCVDISAMVQKLNEFKEIAKCTKTIENVPKDFLS